MHGRPEFQADLLDKDEEQMVDLAWYHKLNRQRKRQQSPLAQEWHTEFSGTPVEADYDMFEWLTIFSLASLIKIL